MTTAPAPRILDILLPLGTTLILATIIAADVTGVDPSGWSYLWAAGIGALLLVRRRYPVVVVFVTVALVIGYHAAGNPPIGVSVPLAAAAFSAAECGRARASLAAAAALLLVSVGYRLWEGQDADFVVGYELPGHAVLLAGVIAFGDSVMSRRRLRRHTTEIADLQAERQAREAEDRRLAERLDLARELHDSVGHALTVVTLHAQVAEEALGEDEATVRRSLHVITDTTSATFQDVRRTVAGLRQGGGGLYPSWSLADLDSALVPARQAGLDVSRRVEVTSTLSRPVQSAIYRIVQEAITNVVRHAQATRCSVTVEEREDMVHVSIIDDGTAARSGNRGTRGTAGQSGTGLAGMRERAQLLGGTFRAGPQETGFAVRAAIPVDARP